MIKSVTAINYRGETCTIVLSEPDPAHGLLITNITGIGPGDATINTSDYATNDGSEFNSARLSARSIQITLLLSDDNDVMTIEKARHNAYRYFPTKKQVRLIFEIDEGLIYIDGRVEKNDPTVFSKNESLTIDIKCSDPYFYKYIPGTKNSEEHLDILSVAPAFEFVETPRTATTTSILTGQIISIVTDYVGVLETPYEVGTYTSSTDLYGIIDYDGDVENGFDGSVEMVGELQGDIVIQRYNSNEYFKIDKLKLEALVGDTIDTGDKILFSTDEKHCYCKIIKDGIETNCLNAVDLEGSTWLLLYPGENIFIYRITDGIDNTQLTITYKTKFQGV